MDKITKLSQAIRLGATFREQCRGSFFNCQQRSCALGSAMEAIFADEYLKQQGPFYEKLKDRFSFLREPVKKLPFKHWESADYASVIIKLNDLSGWSREQIADWLEEQGY